MSQLWRQHNESRVVIGNVTDVLFGYADHLNVRTIIFFNAAMFILSYAGLLALFRRYSSRPLSPIPVLAIGVVWFSVADYQNALWAFQVSWYLTVFFFVMMLCTLLLPETRQPLWLAAAIVLAVAASLSTIQGFVCWPIGAICLLWPTPARRTLPDFAIWLGSMVVTIGVYLRGYQFAKGDTCLAPVQCTVRFEVHHPQTVAAFFFTLIGNVIPGNTSGLFGVHYPARFIALGIALFAASIFIVVHSWHRRAGSEPLPLPCLLIMFALLFDLTIVLGRGGTGMPGALRFNRYVMANLILLTGVLVWALPRLRVRRARPTARWRLVRAYLLPGALAAFLVVQAIAATTFGVTNGSSAASARVAYARLYVNSYPGCVLVQEFAFAAVPESVLRDSAQDQLGEFGPTTYLHYRKLGPTAAEIALAEILGKKITRTTGKHMGRCFMPPLAMSGAIGPGP